FFFFNNTSFILLCCFLRCVLVFVGIYSILVFVTSKFGPGAQGMVERTGINLPVVDLGWPPLSAITWGSPIAPFVIPLTILINVAMLALNKTRTVDVDMWN
ncbi:PTS transporter subunit IIC, partial [Escherichia coli]|uniref:PTS transporter subunit IIC n=1 Tax=Escherichia coli TaxID=562 RepID=UPI0035D49896